MYEIISARGKRTAKATIHTFIVVDYTNEALDRIESYNDFR